MKPACKLRDDQIKKARRHGEEAVKAGVMYHAAARASRAQCRLETY